MGLARLRQRQIADRDDRRREIAVIGVTAAVAERVELFRITEVETGLVVDPGSKASFERSVIARRKRSERQAVGCAGAVGIGTHNEHNGLVVPHCDDRRIEADFNSRVLDLVAIARRNAVRSIHRRFDLARKFHIHVRYPRAPH